MNIHLSANATTIPKIHRRAAVALNEVTPATDFLYLEL